MDSDQNGQSTRMKCLVVSTGVGCLSNLVETNTIRNALNPDTYDKAENADEADVIIINTCGYDQNAEDGSITVIQDFQKKYPDKKIVVGGCLPAINASRVQAAHSGAIVKSGEWASLNTVLDEPIVSTDLLAQDATSFQSEDLGTRFRVLRAGEWVFPAYRAVERLLRREFQPLHNVLESHTINEATQVLSVGRGCLGNCTYCGIKNAKGRLISKPISEIIRDFRQGVASGAQQFQLTGDDVGCWGQDIGSNSAELLKEMLKVPGDYRVVVNYFDPTWLVKHFDSLKNPLSDPRLSCINFPIQSGSSNVLRKMGRIYEIQTVLEMLTEIRKLNPSLAQKTHLMVGFPGETEPDFLKSLETLKYFDVIFPTRFSIRPNTAAGRYSQQVSESDKDLRLRRIKRAIFRQHAQVMARSLARPQKPLRTTTLSPTA